MMSIPECKKEVERYPFIYLRSLIKGMVNYPLLKDNIMGLVDNITDDFIEENKQKQKEK